MTAREPKPSDDEPRWAHRLYAKVMGYFWLPCPLCGEMFGGHEWRDIDGKVSSIPDGKQPGVSHGICPACTRAGRGYELPERSSIQPDPAYHSGSSVRPTGEQA